ncbi:MAG: hypothetical protein IID35_06140 [Planctomycetes bacterium]|nr:hypothetical protein [Planctomycetota bacterium]
MSRTGFMFGGWRDTGGKAAFNDTWQYDVASQVWSPAQASDFAPGTATAFDSTDAPIASINSNLATVFGDPNNFVTLDPRNPIVRIEFFGGVIDNFSFSEAAIPAVSTYGVGTMTLLVLTAGTLVLRRRAGSATRAGQ